jgi:hypothetical protein
MNIIEYNGIPWISCIWIRGEAHQFQRNARTWTDSRIGDVCASSNITIIVVVFSYRWQHK